MRLRFPLMTPFPCRSWGLCACACMSLCADGGGWKSPRFIFILVVFWARIQWGPKVWETTCENASILLLFFSFCRTKIKTNHNLKATKIESKSASLFKSVWCENVWLKQGNLTFVERNGQHQNLLTCDWWPRNSWKSPKWSQTFGLHKGNSAGRH